MKYLTLKKHKFNGGDIPEDVVLCMSEKLAAKFDKGCLKLITEEEAIQHKLDERELWNEKNLPN